MRHELGAVLRDIRVEKGRTLRDVSSLAQVALGYLSEIERGQKEPSSEILQSIADALGVPLSEILAEVSARLALVENRLGLVAAAVNVKEGSRDYAFAVPAQAAGGREFAASAPCCK